MVYTSGIVLDLSREETLEELQDNKLTVVCDKLGLKSSDRLLDVGCGWGTLAAFAAKNYGCDVTGITLGKNQTKFGNGRIKANGVAPSQARILCMDYRDIPGGPGHYSKIVSLEMAEVGLTLHSTVVMVMTSLSMSGFAVTQCSSTKCMNFSTTMVSLSYKLRVSDHTGSSKT
jgi:cyclopropane fatty-acyl-phospholipid synthase-like methyltransferase